MFNQQVLVLPGSRVVASNIDGRQSRMIRISRICIGISIGNICSRAADFTSCYRGNFVDIDLNILKMVAIMMTLGPMMALMLMIMLFFVMHYTFDLINDEMVRQSMLLLLMTSFFTATTVATLILIVLFRTNCLRLMFI